MFDWVDIGLHTLVATVLAWVAVFVSGFDFTGETRGGREFSMAGSLIATAKLNGVNPQHWLTDVLDRVGRGHPINRLDELMPWDWCRE